MSSCRSAASPNRLLAARARWIGVILLTTSFAFAACSSDDDAPPDSPAPATDAATEDAGSEWTWEASPPLPDAEPVIQCTIDNGGDPVGLCIQKFVLTTQHEVAFMPGVGVASRWEATTFVPLTDDAGVVQHTPRDDAAYGAAMARYHASSKKYGDTEMTGQFDADLIALIPIIKTGFATPDGSCSGESYRHLRQIAGGLRSINKTDVADEIDLLADGCGREIFERRYHELPAALKDSDAGVENGSSDGGEAGPAEPRGVIGIDRGNGVYEYEPAEVAASALALLDMAWRHLDDTPGQAEPLQRAAIRSVAYAWERGRHAQTGLLHQRLKTSAGATDEVVGEVSTQALLAEVQGAFALSLLRALEIIETSQKGPETEAGAPGLLTAAEFPWLQRAGSVLEAVNGPAGLWDEEHGGFFEGFVPSTSMRLEAKLVRANGFLLAGIHRWNKVGSSPYGARIGQLRTLMMERFAQHTSLLTAASNQLAYFEAVPRNYTISDSSDPRWTSYSGLANTSGCEALDDGWFGMAD